MIRNDGGPAFPFHVHQWEGGMVGMTLRDYFAAVAIPEMIRLLEAEARDDGHDSPASVTTQLLSKGLMDDGDYYFSQSAKAAYSIADAMLEARDGKESP